MRRGAPVDSARQRAMVVIGVDLVVRVRHVALCGQARAPTAKIEEEAVLAASCGILDGIGCPMIGSAAGR